MATSSIIENIRVNNPKALEAYVEAMEQREQREERENDDKRMGSGVISDPQKVKEFMDKALAKKGIVL